MSRLKLYTLPLCPVCKLVKRFFLDWGIDFEELNAQDYANWLWSKGFNQTPILQIDSDLYFIDSLDSLREILRRYKIIE